MPTLSITRVQGAAQPVLPIRRGIARADLPSMLSECFGKLFAHGHQAGLAIAGWPLATPADGAGEMEPGVLPAGPAAAPWESYVTDPAQHPDPADWRTEVYWPLAQ